MEKLKKRVKEENPAYDLLCASVMLNKVEYDFGAVIKRFEAKWDLDIGPFTEENFLGFIVQGMIVCCTFFKEPISDPALKENVKSDFLWQDAETLVASHAAYILVSVMNQKDQLSAHGLFSKVISSLLESENAIGVYQAPSFFEKSYYIKSAEILLDNKLPTELWVHIHASEAADGFNFATCGMQKFQKNELEIIETKKNFIEAYYYLREIITYTILNDISFNDGETIAPNEFMKNTITVSEGVLTGGMTIKIDY